MDRASQILFAAAALLLTSCGPGTQVAGIEGSGAPAPITATGPVTGFGSIFVNGVEYTTTSAQIHIDDQPGSESQLAVGEIVTVTGTLNADDMTGTATQVIFLGNVGVLMVGIPLLASRVGVLTALGWWVKCTAEVVKRIGAMW